ncbi:MAG: adenine phosphoribosyltransferase [Alphaproteobacteria bacterium]|nr:adenine phosphoribosyltransferase [Alphaproteobacteria bacterium]
MLRPNPGGSVQDLVDRLKATIRDIPDFPKPGILFKDITPVLADCQLLRATVDHFAEKYTGWHIDAVVGMESRGFIFGAPLAMALGASFVPARKPGKLPYRSIGVEYSLEYGTARLEMHVDALKKGQRVLVVDDLLATGGTARATCQLVRQLEADVVACCFVIELSFLNGRDELEPMSVESLVIY